MNHYATYSPEDNKLRLYPAQRLDADEYQRVKAAGFSWAPKQELFVAPMWTPSREDLLLSMCPDGIGDEDTSLVERAEQRAERFEDYSDRRADDAERARAAVSAIADNIPFGQPILVGHHSERRARKDAEKIENGMRKAVANWKAAEYWTDRAQGAIRHAKYKERPDVRARRIKGIEADKRKQERNKAEAEKWLRMWGNVEAIEEAEKQLATARTLAGVCHLYMPKKEGDRGDYPTAWDALKDDQGDYYAPRTIHEVFEAARSSYPRQIAHADRWIAHYKNRLAYERAMLAEDGGTVTDRKGPEKGGGCKCWASPRGGWAYIQKVNKVSVTILDNWGNGGRNFTRTIEFDKLTAVTSKAEVDKAREEGRLIESQDGTGFGIVGSGDPSRDESQAERNERLHREAVAAQEPSNANTFQQMGETLRAGVQVVTAPQLFPTSPELAARMVEEAGIETGHRVLEPSVGTGNIARAVFEAAPVQIVAVEQNVRVLDMFRCQYHSWENSRIEAVCGDFLEQNGNLGKFDRVVMNPPFENGADIRHIKHALNFLKPGGRLVALCANGPRQREQLLPLAEQSGGWWEDLPAGTFKEQGTNVNTALLVIEA